MGRSRKYLISGGFFILAMAAGWLFLVKKEKISAPLPLATNYNAVLQEEKSDSSPSEPIPDEINLNIPFIPQAPHQNWAMPYQEFCEEASMLMTASYINNQTISGPDDADNKLLAIKNFEEKKFGFYEDTTAEETATVLKEHFNINKVEVTYNPTVELIKKALAQGKAVIIPAAGRQLGNPYFQNPGPLYHMLVVKGYTKNGEFITNDPGTKRGFNFRYKEDAIINAIHDWNDGNVNTGEKVIIIVG